MFRRPVYSWVTMKNQKSTPAPVVEERLYSKAKPLAKSLGICARTLVRWANAGCITRRKLGARTTLYDVAEVRAYVESCKV